MRLDPDKTLWVVAWLFSLLFTAYGVNKYHNEQQKIKDGAHAIEVLRVKLDRERIKGKLEQIEKVYDEKIKALDSIGIDGHLDILERHGIRPTSGLMHKFLSTSSQTDC